MHIDIVCLKNVQILYIIIHILDHNIYRFFRFNILVNSLVVRLFIILRTLIIYIFYQCSKVVSYEFDTKIYKYSD